MSEQTGHAYLKSHQISGEVLQADLEQEQEAILTQARAAGSGHTAKTLVKDGPLRVVLIGFSAGSNLREHSAEGPVTIQALQGEAVVSSKDGDETLSAGSMLVFGGGIKHSVEASRECVLLLTIAQAA